MMKCFVWWLAGRTDWNGVEHKNGAMAGTPEHGLCLRRLGDQPVVGAAWTHVFRNGCHSGQGPGNVFLRRLGGQ